MMLAFMLQAAPPVTNLRNSLDQWRDCVRSSAKASEKQTVETMFADAIDQCQLEQERYRSAVVDFASAKDGLTSAQLGQAADQIIADKKANFRADFGSEIAEEVAVRQTIRRVVAEHDATAHHK